MSIFFASPIEQDPIWPITNLPSMTNQNASFPVSNLLTYDPTQVAAVTISGISVITWDFGLERKFDVVSLLHGNFNAYMNFMVEGSLDGTSWDILRPNSRGLAHIIGSPTITTNESDTDPRRQMQRTNHTLYNSSIVHTYRHLRITIDGNGKIPQIGRLFVGRKFVPSTGWQYGSQISFQDMSKRERTDRGALVLDPINPIVAAAVKMEFLSKTEMMDFIYEFNYWRGSAREILACLDVEDTPRLQKNLLYCTIAEGRQISYDAFNTHSQTWILESIAS